MVSPTSPYEDILDGKVDVSEVYQNYSATGKPTSFGIDLRFSELKLHRQIKSRELHLLFPKVESTLESWRKKYSRHLDELHKQRRAVSVDALNAEAKRKLESFNGLLAHTLTVDDAVDWASLKRKDSFEIDPASYIPTAKPEEKLAFDLTGRPVHIQHVDRPSKPTLAAVRQEYAWWSRTFRTERIRQEFARRLGEWSSASARAEQEAKSRESLFREALRRFDSAKAEFDERKRTDNEAVDALKKRYETTDPGAVEEYCDIVLGASQYPDGLPQDWVLEYRSDGRMIVVDYDLPAPSQLPTTESYRYVKARDEVVEKALSASARKKLYENTIYQICIRTIHELFEADVVDALDAVALNGLVTDVNPATGVEEQKTILSVLANKIDFLRFDLTRIDPKATFKHLKGVAASALVELAAIPPVVALDKTDKRFVAGKAVAAHIDDSVNLAAMDWEDFEHLVTELFEQEFTAGGGEVRVTQASADGGVDAIAFDPDPIRGGKIVIQAKRYTNTVEVAAVRELYGTVVNEGATKGILVTTSDYGKASYDFAKDKPLTLLNGSNLLSLLEKHGQRARINVKEAKAAQKRQ